MESETAETTDRTTDRRRTRHQHRRGELLAACWDYVERRGLAGLSLRPLAEDVGVSAATLLHHFGSKEQLAVELSRFAHLKASQRVTAFLERERGRAQDPFGAFEAEVRHQLRDDANGVRSFFEIYGLALQDPALYREFLDGFVNWLPVIEAALRAEGCPKQRVAGTATLILAASRGLSMDFLATGDADRLDAALASLRALIETLLSGSART